MEERRFDAWARTLGAATTRRQVLKGVLGGVLAGVFASKQGSAQVDAASSCPDATSSPQAIRSCEQAAMKVFSERMGICHSEAYGGYKAGGVGAILGCTVQAERNLRDQLHACRTQAVCPTGNFCCGEQCCPAEEWCCPSFASGTRVVSCVDRQTDSANCGGCGNRCDDDKICQNGQCVCPPDKRLCSEGLGDVCCASDEDCGVNAFFVAICVPKCKKCEVYDSNTKTCKPKQCGTCQVCDPDTGQCLTAPVGTPCGSGLVCCGETCQGANEQCNDQGDAGGCPECQEYDVSGSCVPKDDGTTCGNCGKCSNGACIPDPAQSCPTCQSCGAGGACLPIANNTSCGSNQICCNGACTNGTQCCDEASGHHLCPPDVHGDQFCCLNGQECCATDVGSAICGDYFGSCCDVGTQFACGYTNPICCDYATEDCSSLDGGQTGHCCPKGQVVVSDGTCCPSDSTCGADTTSQFCCDSGTSCSLANDPNSSDAIYVCCPPDQSAVSDGTCCPTAQICSSGKMDVCCASGMQCASDYTDNQIAACCSDSNLVGTDGTCCSANQFLANCSDGTAVCCTDEGGDDACCSAHGGAAA